MIQEQMIKNVRAGVLNVGYWESGKPNGKTVILLHGFPYDVQAYGEVVPILVSAGCHVITPYLRGFGPTRFLSEDAPRSGQQAALAHDLIAFMDALNISNAVLAGYDWGARAACIVAALLPERVHGLLAGCGYSIQNIAQAKKPQLPDDEFRYWYQYYFHTERGKLGLFQYRRELCKLLWRQWSPTWQFDDSVFNRTSISFENPDFVNVVIHSYRHRFGLASGDPRIENTESRLRVMPRIIVPAIVLHGKEDWVAPPSVSEFDAQYFMGRYERMLLPLIGHNLPQEDPSNFADAVLSLVR